MRFALNPNFKRYGPEHYYMKITILWSQLADYSIAFFKSLKEQCGCEIQLIYQPVSHDAPYGKFDLSFCIESDEDSSEKRSTIETRCIQFKPDCVLMSSWGFPHYMRIAKKLKDNGCYVVSAMDNQWRGTIKQWLGTVSSRWFLKRSIDTFLVAGDRQALFARKLGYDDVMYGCYAADIEKYRIEKQLSKREKNFLYIGRLKKIKGVDILINAYQIYRDMVDNPWGLIIAGTGEMESIGKGISGIQHLGFMPPDQIPITMASARCLILPSRFEQWGVVIHEASAAGLPIISSHACGAVTAFVRDGVNGYIIPPKANKLSQAMYLISEASDEELELMSEYSKKLSSLWNPHILARYFCSNINFRCKDTILLS